MTILAIYKLLLYGGLAFIVGSLVALEVFLNWKYPLPPQPARGRQADLDADRPCFRQSRAKLTAERSSHILAPCARATSRAR
jgi:hypothetical protein